jgi:nicotinate phosphoribosyltransferase
VPPTSPGSEATSNLEAGRRYGIPTLGHGRPRLRDDPRRRAVRVREPGHRITAPESTLLVDTYDTPEGIERASKAGGTELDGMRIDSGDLGEEARARP